MVLSITAKSGFRGNRHPWLLRMVVAVLLAGNCRWADAQQISESEEFVALPDAPQAQSSPKATDAPSAGPPKKCPPVKQAAKGLGGAAGADVPSKSSASGCRQKFDFLYPLGKPPGHGQPLTSTDKLRIAASDVVDPFNLLTIAATAAITVGKQSPKWVWAGIEGLGKELFDLAD